MSEITRKALEGMGFVKDFEVYRFCYPYARDRGWIEVIIERKNVSVCANAEWNGFIEVPVATLPQLRQLIRALFGDEALPRRELSSITDEELKNLFNIVSGDDYRPDEIIESKRMESCWNVGILDYIIVSLSDLGLVSYFPNNFYHDEVTPEAYNYLVNELDFHLPAFHDDKGGEQ